MSYLLPRSPPEDAKSISAFRERFHLPVDRPCPPQWVIGFINIGKAEDKGGDHYFTILFMPKEKEIHLLGKRHKRASERKQPVDWKTWGGSNIWNNVAILHGWNQDTKMAVYEVNWVQNGYDCGVTVCQVIEIIWKGGFRQGQKRFWRRPTLPCCHLVRKRMATDIHQITLSNITAFNNLIASHPPATLDDMFHSRLQESIAQVEDVETILEPNPGSVLQELLNTLNKAISACTLCNDRSSPQAAQQVSQQKPRGAGSEGDLDVENDDLDVEKKDKELPLDHEDPTDLEQSTAHVDLKLAVMGRYPRPMPPPVLPPLTTMRGLRIPSDNAYDEYENGPTLEDVEAIPDTIALGGELDLVYLAGQVITNPWASFRDYGHRIEPDFAQTFHLSSPIMVKEHLMPVGIVAPGDDDIAIQKSRSGDDIDLTDVVVMGAQEMIEKADEEGSNDIFLTGKTKEGQYIKLDLGRDSIKPTVITLAADVDSFIWVTRYPVFKHAINIFAKPVIRNKPPIHKHNHIYVDLLCPQSEDDQLALGARSEWYSQRFKLSQIPHIQLGKMGDGAGSVNLLMAFPRMTHRHPHVSRWVNIVPADVQNLLWDKVIIPAMRIVMPEVNHSYVGLDRTHLAFKEKGKGPSKMAPTFPFRRNQFIALIEEIKSIVSRSTSLGFP